MGSLIYVKNEQQLQFIRQKMSHALTPRTLYLTVDPQVWYELASDSKAVLWAGDFVGGDDWMKIEDEALSLRDGWYRPIEQSLVYEGINLAELIRLEHTHFFRQIVRSQTILERILQEYAVRHVIVIGQCDKPCWAGERANNKSGVFEGVLLWEAYKRGIGIERISFEVAPSEPEPPKAVNPGQVGNRIFAFDCWENEDSSKLIAVGSPFHLIILHPFVQAWNNQTGSEGLLLNLSRSIEQGNKRAGFQLPQNTRFVSVADFSIYNQSVEYVQTQRRILEAFDRWNKSREQIQDKHILKNPHLNFHWTFIWNSLIQLPAVVQKAFEALRVMDPDVVLTCEMASSNVRVFTEAAKKKGILTVDCPHGYVGDIEEFQPHGDLYLAWGRAMIRQLAQRFKIDSAPIVVTGSPINEKVIKSKSHTEKRQLYEKTGLSPNKKTVCVVTRSIFANVWPVNIKEFFARCDEIASLALNQDIQIIIKISPRADHAELYKRIFGPYPNIFVCTEYSLDELLPVIDIGIMFFYVGTASLLFLHKGIPTIFVRNKSTVSFTDLAWQVFGDNEPLSKLCQRFLYDAEAKRRRLAMQKSFAQQHLYIDDNDVAVRAARTIKDALKGSRKPIKRTRQRRDILTPPPQAEPGQIGCLAIFTPQVGKVSETFIARQINNIAPDRTVLVTGVMNNCLQVRQPYLIIPYSTGPSVYHAEVEERVVRFLAEHRVTHILCQYGCYGTDIIELNQKRLHLPIFVHFHGGDASAMLRNPTMPAYYKWMGTRVTGVIAVSEKMANRLAAIGIPAEKIRVIPCGVEIPSGICAHPERQPCHFVSVIRMVPKKAPLLLLRAFRKVRDRIADCTLDIIGDGPLFAEAKQFVDANSLNNSVMLHGARSNEHVVKCMHTSCVYVQHSITDPQTGDAEGLPVAILEASIAGLPVVSTLHEGIPDEVQHGVTGFLVEEGDVDAMADYMTKLAQSPDMRRTMGTAAYEKIAAEFAMPQWMQRLRGFLTSSTANDVHDTGDKAGDKAAFKAAIELNPNSAQAHNDLGRLYYEMGDIRDAMRCFTNAFKLNLTDSNTVSNICRLYKRMGWTQETESLMRECSQKNLRNHHFSKEIELSNVMPQVSRKTDLKFSFIMIVLNGMPFIEYSLKSIYDFAHQIIIAEGAVTDCMFAANPDGSSRDGTVEFIKSFPDPENKIKLIQAKWPEKCEMQNQALKHVTGDYVWLIDSDEVYKSCDLEKIDELFLKDPSITQVNFIPDNFWKGLDYIFVSPMFFEQPHHFRRLFKYVPGAQFTTHRPPTMVWPNSSVTTEQMHLIDGNQTREMGIIPCHYSYVLHEQVGQKIGLYRRYGWAERWKIDLNEWYNKCFLKWTPENRKQIEANHGVWTGDKNSYTIPFTGEHPEVMLGYIRKFRNGNTAGMQKERCWEEEQIHIVVGNPYYQKKVIEAWSFLETDESVVKRRNMMLQHIRKGAPFWNIHVALAFIAEKLNPRSYLEVGVRTGCSLVQVLHNSNVGHVVGVDIWDGNYAGFPNTLAYATRQIEAYKSRTNKNFKIEFIAGNSHEKLKELIKAGRKFDLITVDGDHSEIGASEDLEDAVKLLNERGAIVFDDIIHQSFPFLKDVANRFQRKYPCFQALTNSTQDNGCVIFLKNIDTTGLLGASPAAVSSGKAKNVKVAEDYVKTGMQVDTESSFAAAIQELFAQIRPKRIVETGTFLGTGTTTVIAGALRSLGLDAAFYTIEVNPAYCARAKEHLRSQNFNVTVLNGLSVPRSSLPTIEQIKKTTVTDIEFDDTFVDHRADVRAKKYYEETDFGQVPDNLLYHCLKSFDFRPDFVLLDSAGHIGNIEFNHLVGLLQGPCYIALDDIYHIKHHKSFEQIQSDRRFKLITSSREKFGFCIAKFTPQPKPSRKEVKNVLWVRTDSIGDAVLSSSMLPYVRERFPGARITVVCQAHIAPLYEACPFVNTIITVPSEHKWESQPQYEAVIREIQKVRPDILLNSTFATHGLADIRGLEFIPRRVAFRNVRWASYTDIVPTEGRCKSELSRHCDFLNGIGINVSSLKPQVWITDDDDKFAKEVFTKHGLDPDRTIVLFAGTRTDHRRYERYGEALSRICKKADYSVIALGNDRDYRINQQNLEAIGVRAVNLSGATTLRQTAAILKRCRLAVGAETAIAHMACAVGTPNVILLGGGHFGRFMPYSSLTSVVCLPLECYGCDWQCRYDKIRCVTDVSVEVFAEAVRQTLAASSQKPRVFAQSPSLLNPKPGEQRWKILDQLIDIESIEIISPESKTPDVDHNHSVQSQIDVSIVLCTKDRAALLDKMLASLKAAVQGITCELIVIEGASSDNTLDVLRAHGVKNIYDEAHCLGPGRHSWPQLYNFGFSKARGKWAMYASDDILFSKGCISRAVELLNAQKDEVAGGIFFFKNTHARPDWDKFGIDFTLGPKLLMNYGLVRLDHFRAVGGLDEAYRFYCADGDLCFKLYEAGRQFIPLPGCFVVHDNVLDASRQANADNSNRDIELYIQRWKHFVSPQRPEPRRLLWHDDFAEAFNLPASLPKIDSAIEHFWHGLACYQYSMFEQAKLKFLEAIHSKCDHWLVLWYLAKVACECGDEPLAKKAADAVLQLEPDFLQAKDLLTRLGSELEQAPKPASTRIENDADAFPMYRDDDVLKNIKVHNDSPGFDDVGFDNSDCQTNGEFALLRCLIKPGDIVLDIGANTGQWSGSVLAAVGKVHLHSFEPVADTFAVLKTNLGSSGAHLHDIAIADNNGPKTFYHYNQNSKLARMSSFYRRNPAVEQQFNVEPVPISVQAQTLDSFCREHSIPHVDFIKIDTEGGEFDVLRGATGLLRAHSVKMLQFEYGGTYPDAGITLQQVCRLLSSYGYVIFRILPDSFVHIAKWRDLLENNRYSNYLAVSSRVAGNYTIMQNLPVQKTHPDYDLEAVAKAPAPFLVRPETDILSQLKDGRLWSEGKPLRLHLGCGKWHFDGYINIDYPPEEHNVVTHLGADLYADITKLNFPAHSVDEIRLHHVFEHFDRVTALGLLIKWHEWLKTGCTLRIETPDLIGSAKTLLSDALLKTKIGVVRHLAGDQADKWAFHTDHWFGQRFEHTLTQLGFGPVRVRTSSWPHEPYLSNVQVEAAKQVHLTREQLLAACDKLLLDSLVSDAHNELKKHEIWMRRLRTFLDETAASYSKAEHPVDEAVACNQEPAAQNDVATEIVGLIFSKDRPMQLAAAIESFALHCLDNANIKLHVLYKASNDIYRAQYDTLKNEFADITFIEETDFKTQTLAVISEYEYVLFLVDDNLFVKDFKLAEIVGLLKQNHNALGFSLRLGKNTTYSYARDAQVTLPPFWYVAKSVLKYDWTRGRIHFAYPLEVSSSIYRAADIEPLLKKLDFDNPNMLEGLMAANTQLYARSRAALLCYEQSAAFCNPLNIVQNVSDNRAGSKTEYSADRLAQMFDRGLRIDVRRYAGFVPNSPHQEVQLEFVKLGSDSQSDKPLVSVEMIAYNAQKYIAAAIDSVLAQTYKNFELLIVDDGSGDRTKEIISSYSDSRIRYIHKPHKNRWSGTNVAIARANGQYIITVDSDDFIATDYIEKMVACARRYPDVDYFYPACLTLVDQFGNPTGGRWDYLDFSDNTILPNLLFENAFSPIPHPGGMKRKSLYQRLGGYEEVQNAADFVFLCRNSLKIRFKRVGDHSTYFYRLLPTSLSHKFEARNKITADILNEMVSIYPPEVLCPQIGHITEPALRRQQYYKYLMEIFYKHVHGHMVKFGDYFRRYGDYYKQQLLKMIGTRDNLSPAFGCDHAGHEKRSLICRR